MDLGNSSNAPPNVKKKDFLKKLKANMQTNAPTTTTTTPQLKIDEHTDNNLTGGSPPLITTFGNVNKKKLRDFYNSQNNTQFKTIYQIRTHFNPDLDANETYAIIADIYNTNLLAERDRVKRENELVYFTANVNLEITKFKDNFKELDTPEISNKSVNFSSQAKRKDIDRTIRNHFNKEDSYEAVVVLDYSLTQHKNKKDYEKYTKPANTIMMRRASVLKMDWLKHAKSIGAKAFEDSNNKCVYYQLTDYLLNPPSARPNKFLDREHLTQEVMYEFLKNEIRTEDLEGDYKNFSMDDGVSCELVRLIAKETKRNMYCFDENDKVIETYIHPNNDRNYCPIVFYCIHGHMYLLNDPNIFKSVSHTKTTMLLCDMMINQPPCEKGTKPLDDWRFYDNWTLENAYELSGGNYFVDDVPSEFLKFVNKYRSLPKVKSYDTQITQFSYENKKRELVVVCIDKNKAFNISTFEIQALMQSKQLTYRGETIGNIILKLLNVIKETKVDDEDANIFTINPYASSFNANIYKNVFQSYYFDTIQFVMSLKDQMDLSYYYQNGFKVFKTDIKKCRRNLMLTNKYQYAKFSVMDEVKPYANGNEKSGIYFIKTELNTPPFKKAGWYGYAIKETALKDGLINQADILFQIIPSETLPANYFVEKVETLLEFFRSDVGLQKKAVNSFVGILGRKNSTHTKIEFTTDLNEASNKAYASTNGRIRNEFQLDNGEVLYEIITQNELIPESTNYIIYKHILELEALELYEMSKKIKSNGGVPVEFNTDAILYFAKKEIILDDVWSEEIGNKYQSEKPYFLKYSHTTIREFDKKYLSKFDAKNWNILQDNFNSIDDFKAYANELIASENSVLITGQAGTGKTTLINYILEKLDADEIKYIALSPTNKARNLLKCKNKYTLHKFYYKFVGKQTLNALLNYDYIFIDEISMVCSQFYKFLITIKKSLPKMKFIIAGDFNQLEPVKDIWTGDYYNTTCLKELCGFNNLQLTKIRRANTELTDAIEKALMKNDVSDFKKFENLTFKNLAFTNDTRKKINEICNEAYIKQFNKKYIIIEKYDKRESSQEFKLCVGLPVICCKNSNELDIFNNEQFEVVKITKDEIIISDNAEEKKIERSKFNQYFNIGFCITIHASQGETYTEPYTIHDWGHFYMNRKAKYVALSRATQKDLIQIHF